MTGTVFGNVAAFASGFFSDFIFEPIKNMTWVDILDILVLTVVLYSIYLFVIDRRAGKLAVGLAIILLVFALGNVIELRAFQSLLSGSSSFAITLLIIIFQPELRDALEKIGNTPTGLILSGNKDKAAGAHTVYDVVDAAVQIAQRERDGALIVIEGSTKLGDYAERGEKLDAEVSDKLLTTIFVDKSPLHDGAVIIRGDRIIAAGAKLPLSQNEEDEQLKNLGTRHRAGVGISEVSDCVVVLVSEETHIISIANNGMLKRDYNRGASDFKDSETAMAIKKHLREDLFRILTGGDSKELEKALVWADEQREKNLKKSGGARKADEEAPADDVKAEEEKDV
ncbi:MAG: TIGR00159 family protein [Ruminococcaceae bacterium]|nr:TIGR00159 family protein [Oscillospiraceae bacterium]